MPEAIGFCRNWAIYFRRELEHNTSGILLQRYTRLASDFPSDFPDPSVLNLYVNPLISTHGSIPSFTWLVPDVGKLASLAEDNFVWGHLSGILTHFADTVFPGLALRELIGAALQKDHQPNPFSSLVPLIDPTKPIISE